MEKVILFYLEDCPYCHYAKRAIEELKKENPKYSGIDIEWIEESRYPEVADRYNYYYVPTIFYGDKKLYEASPSEDYVACKNNIRTALDDIKELEKLIEELS